MFSHDMTCKELLHIKFSFFLLSITKVDHVDLKDRQETMALQDLWDPLGKPVTSDEGENKERQGSGPSEIKEKKETEATKEWLERMDLEVGINFN